MIRFFNIVEGGSVKVELVFSQDLDPADFDVLGGNGAVMPGQRPPVVEFSVETDGNTVTLSSSPVPLWPAPVPYHVRVRRKSDDSEWIVLHGGIHVAPALAGEAPSAGYQGQYESGAGFAYSPEATPAVEKLSVSTDTSGRISFGPYGSGQGGGDVYTFADNEFTGSNKFDGTVTVGGHVLDGSGDALTLDGDAVVTDEALEAVKEDMDGKYDKAGGTIKGSAYVGQGGASVVYPVTYVDLPEGWRDMEGFGLHIGLGGTTMDGPTLQGLADAAAVCDKVNSFYRNLWIKPFAYPVSDSKIAITAGVALPHIVKYTIVTFWVESIEVGGRVRYVQRTIAEYNVGDDIAPSTTACGASSTITEGGVIRDSILKVRLLEGETVLYEREFDTSGTNYYYISKVIGAVGDEMGVAYYSITPYGMVGASTGVVYATSAGSRSNDWVLEVSRWSVTGDPSVSTYALGALTQGKGNDKDVPTVYSLKLNGLDVLTTESPQFSRQQALVAGHETRIAALEASAGPSAPETSLPADLKLKHGHLYLLDCTDGLDLSTIEVQTYASFKLWLDCSQAGDVQFPSFWHVVDGLEPGYDGAGRYMYDAVNNGSAVLLVHVAHYYDA